MMDDMQEPDEYSPTFYAWARANTREALTQFALGIVLIVAGNLFILAFEDSFEPEHVLCFRWLSAGMVVIAVVLSAYVLVQAYRDWQRRPVGSDERRL